MPAYSKTPLAQKLGIKDRARFLLVGAPASFDQELPTLPSSAIRAASSAREVDVIVFFAPDTYSGLKFVRRVKDR